jgi:5'-3' exonuclease
MRELKILYFIITQRTFKEFNSNTLYCIYGADVDLIMILLIIHELNFYIKNNLIEKLQIIMEFIKTIKKKLIKLNFV